MILSTLQKKLNSLGFETVVADKVLQAAKETGDTAVEITVDSGGGTKVVKKRRENVKKISFILKKKKIPIVCENLSTETFRVQLDSPDDLDILEKNFFKA